MVQQVEVNRAAQEQLYGEPLADLFRRLMATFDCTQGALATTLGISAPMLSQLMSANRVKIGNPAVVLRLQALQDLAQRVTAGEVQQDDVEEALTAIRSVSGQWTRSEAIPATAPSDDDVATTLRQLLRAVASGQELRTAADLLRTEHPALAQLLEDYGLGSPAAAREHLRSHRAVM